MSLFSLITKIVNDLERNGYTNAEQLAYFSKLIRDEAIKSMLPEAQMIELLSSSFRTIYKRLIGNRQIEKRHKGIPRFTVNQLETKLQLELNRRIAASADLIKLNRQEAVEKTLRRLAGWATSIPEGGQQVGEKPEVKKELTKALKSLPFVERRVLIDQGHKFTSNLNNILASNGGAIAVEWNSHWKQANYDYREDHKQRDKKIYLLKNNWAQEKGLVKPSSDGYYEDITAFGEEPFCRCYGTYLYNLNDIPLEMLTQKGQTAVKLS